VVVKRAIKSDEIRRDLGPFDRNLQCGGRSRTERRTGACRLVICDRHFAHFFAHALSQRIVADMIAKEWRYNSLILARRIKTIADGRAP
jgi:hypothetical protein